MKQTRFKNSPISQNGGLSLQKSHETSQECNPSGPQFSQFCSFRLHNTRLTVCAAAIAVVAELNASERRSGIVRTGWESRQQPGASVWLTLEYLLQQRG